MFVFNPLSGQLDASGGSSVDVDTKANILASTATSGAIGFSTDTREFFLADGTNWNVASLKLSTELEAPDMGATENNDKLGYSDEYFTNLWMYNMTLGGNTLEVEGGIRINHETTPKTFDIYENGAWRSLKVFRFDNVLYHVINNTTFEVHTGNSTLLDIHDQPLIQDYKVPIDCNFLIILLSTVPKSIVILSAISISF